MAAVQAYFDESGTDEGSPYVVIAGALGNLSSWKTLNAGWHAVLDKHGFKVFHSVDLSHLRKEFERRKGWTVKQRERIINSLLKVISHEQLVPFGIAVDVGQFEEAASYYPENKMRPYDYGLRLVVGQIHKYLRGKKHKSLVAVTFESGQQLREPFVHCLKNPEAVSHYKTHIGVGNVNFADKLGNGPLQVADLVAYELLKFLKRHGNVEADDIELRYPLRKLGERFHNWIHAVSTVDGIRGWFDHLFEWYAGPNPKIKTEGCRLSRK
jgi:hypothetical protein